MSETITYGGVKFIRHTETYEIRKNQTGTIQYYTKIDTGESGMSVQGLANACGVARPALDKLFQTFVFEGIGNQNNTALNLLNSKKEEGIGKSNPTILEGATKSNQNEINILSNNEKEGATKPHDFYLIEANDAHVIRDIYCERVIYYYAFESHYKKSKAKELYQILAQHGLRVFIQTKTGYQPILAPQHDNSLTLSIEEQLKQEIAALKLQLVEKDETIRQLEYKPIYEKTHQAHLYAQWGGIREFHVGSPYPGRIDLVTDQMVVEVKRVANFEIAFGQLLRYRAQLEGTEHEYKTYMLYLFGDVTEDERRILQAMAKRADFQLMIECNLKDFMDANELSARDKIKIVFSNDDVAVA